MKEFYDKANGKLHTELGTVDIQRVSQERTLFVCMYVGYRTAWPENGPKRHGG
jgi:hypothetical protein